MRASRRIGGCGVRPNDAASRSRAWRARSDPTTTSTSTSSWRWTRTTWTLRKRAPAAHHHKIRLFRDLDPEEPGLDVPDPYYGPEGGFEDVLDIVTRTSQALLEELRRAK